jgi:hypothetical protein
MEAERRAALAQMLEAQAYEPLNVNQAAPIAPSQGLAKILKSYVGAYQRKKAEEAEEKAKGEEIETASQIMGRLTGRELPEFEPDEEKRAANQAAEAQRIADMRAETEASIARQRETGQLEEITLPASLRYIRDPEEALRLADTPAGQAALKNRPVMAARLAELLKTPTEAEYATTPQFDAEGRAYVINKAGNVKYLEDVTAAKERPTLTELGKLIRERDALPPDSPLRASYDARIAKESERAGPLVVNYGAPVAGVDEQGNPIFFQPSKTGEEISVIAGARPAPKGMNESQSKAAGFADRVAESSPILDSGPVGLEATFLAGMPGGIGNFALTPQQQTFLQAERNFINAVLRRESGAVISPEEFTNARQQYIPQPGDGPEVLEQKRRNRQTVQRSFVRDAGPSYQPVIDLPPRRAATGSSVMDAADAILGGG